MEIISNINPIIIYIIIALLLIGMLIALFKKALKTAVTIIVIIILFTFLGPILKNFQDRYNIKIDGESLEITLDGKTTNIENIYEIDDIKVENTETTSDTTVTFIYSDGTEKVVENMPSFLSNSIEDYLTITEE